MSKATELLKEAMREGLLFSDVLAAFNTKNTPDDVKLIQRAQEICEEEGFLEIDDVTVVSRADGEEGKAGAYVLAWLWVDQEPPADEQ